MGGGLTDEKAVAKFLIHLNEVPVDCAEGLVMGLGSFRAKGGSPDKIERAFPLLCSKERPVDGAFPGLDVGAAAFHRDPVEGTEGADGTETSARLLGDKRGTDTAQLSRVNAGCFDYSPYEGGAVERVVA